MKDREAYNAHMRSYLKERRGRRRIILQELLGGKCERCGTASKLEFHHKDQTQKSFNVSCLDKAWDRLVAEANKCILLCESCHDAEYHDRPTPWNKGTWRHGTPSGYGYHKCRCGPCSEVYSAYRKKLPSRKRVS